MISGTNEETDPEGILEYMLCLTFLTVTVPAGVSQWLVTPEVKGGKNSWHSGSLQVKGGSLFQ